jgi:hypothetical protein
LKIGPAEQELRRYDSNWLGYMTRIMLNVMLNYRPDDLEDLGRDY